MPTHIHDGAEPVHPVGPTAAVAGPSEIALIDAVVGEALDPDVARLGQRPRSQPLLVP